MLGYQQKQSSLQAKKLNDIAGHIKDALTHSIVTPETDCVNHFTDKQYLNMAVYLDNIGLFDNNHETPYTVLRNSIDNALDIRDESGTPLREFCFRNTGFVSVLQETLLKGLRDAEDNID